MISPVAAGANDSSEAAVMLHPFPVMAAKLWTKKGTILIPWDSGTEETLEAPTSSAPRSAFLVNHSEQVHDQQLKNVIQ